jgi:hypothetical protein
MANFIDFLDEVDTLVQEYLMFRGFTNTFAAYVRAFVAFSFAATAPFAAYVRAFVELSFAATARRGTALLLEPA